MRSLPSHLAVGALVAALGALAVLAQPSPPQAQANPGCDLATLPTEAISEGVDTITGGLIGAGNPAGDACNAVTDGALGVATKPITDAAKGLGNNVLDQITTWVSEGATWLIGKVAEGIDETTTPKLSAKGFVSEYAKMAQIAAVLAAAMLLLAILEALAQGSWAILGRVLFVNLPLAFLATSVGFAVVQLLLFATDAMGHAIAAATEEHSQRFFKSAIAGLGNAGAKAGGGVVGGTPGEVSGAVDVPLFVTFLAAIVGAFAAFFVWLEMLMRDAAVYVVALFMPLSLAASIWPRWSGALRRTVELEVVVIGSKFVIVSILALAAGLAAENDGGIEPLLAASALMLLACFSPFVLLKLVPFAEGAMSAAYGRRSAAGGTVSGLQLASDVAILRNMARSNWGDSTSDVWEVKGAGGGGTKGGEGGAAASSPEAAAAAAPVDVAKGAKSAGEHLGQTATARAAGEDGAAPPQGRATPGAPESEGSATNPTESSSSESAQDSPRERPARPPSEVSAKPEREAQE
jgi:hypothetical protein